MELRTILTSLLALYLLGISLSIDLFSLPENEYQALELFYMSTGGPDWVYNNNSGSLGYPWVFTDPPQNPCNATQLWNGLTCSSTCELEPCHIIKIYFSTSNLVGTIPNEIDWLTELQYIRITGNPNLNGMF